MTVFVGLDIGGTKIMVAAADCEGNISRRARVDTSTSLETDLANINRMIAEVAAEEEIAGHSPCICQLLAPSYNYLIRKELPFDYAKPC